MPDQAEPPSPRQPAGRASATVARASAVSRAPVPNGAPSVEPSRSPALDAVLFDFHGTLAQVEDPISWVREAATACGTHLEYGEATVLADRLVTAGRAGGPLPRRVPPHLIEVWAERDLYPHAHRAAFTGLADTVTSRVEGLSEALYDRVTRAEGWRVYADTLATLRTLKAAGIPIAVVSNIGFDIRPMLDTMGLGGLIDAHVLSFEIGRCKPDPAIFHAACAALRVDPSRALMVGDTPNDAAAVAVGCCAYVVPAAGPGESNGLGAVSSLVGCDVRRN